MYDHLLRFPDEAAAFAALKPLGLAQSAQDIDGGAVRDVWDRSQVNSDVDVITQRAEFDLTDPDNPKEIKPRITWPGFFVLVGFKKISGELLNLPGNACRLVLERETKEVLYHADDINDASLNEITIDGIHAGSVGEMAGARNEYRGARKASVQKRAVVAALKRSPLQQAVKKAIR